MNYLNKLKGKRTYTLVAAAIILGVLEGFDIFEIPTPWWIVITAAGFGFMRAPINRIEKLIEELRKKGDK